MARFAPSTAAAAGAAGRAYVAQLTPSKKKRLLPRSALATLKERARPDNVAATGPSDLAARA
eukprot:6630326-Pyramimonas_sp.AAC.1